MKITSVELHPDGSAFVAVFSFRDPTRQNPYNVKTMAGLDAEGVVPKFYGTSADATQSFYNLALQKREPVMRVELNPQWANGKTYSDLRDDLYKLIASSRTGLVQIQFKNGANVVAAISGQVTKLEADLFAKSPEVQLTFECEDPMLRALVPVNVPVAGLNLADVNLQDLLSTAPHAFDFTLTYTAAVASLVLKDPASAAWNFTVTPAGGFLNGDVLHFSSEPKAKLLYLVRGGVTTYLADKIVAGSVWPIMFPGDNHISDVNAAHMTLNAISYYPTYWGV